MIVGREESCGFRISCRRVAHALKIWKDNCPMLSEQSTVTLVQPGAWVVNLSGLKSNILHALDRLGFGK